MSGIRFGDDPPQLSRVRFEARVPAGITSKQHLLEVLDRELRFPDYFGMNWDALNEVIHDLSWIPMHQVVIRHDDVPLETDPTQQAKYVAILTFAVGYWLHHPQHDLLIVFPVRSRHMIESLR